MGHCHPARSRQGGAQLFGLVLRRSSGAVEDRNSQSGQLAREVAQRAPVGRVIQLSRHLDPQAALSVLIEEDPEFGHPAEKGGSDGALGAVSGGPRSQDGVRVDHGRGFGPGADFADERHIADQIRGAGKGGNEAGFRSHVGQLLLHAQSIRIIFGKIDFIEGHEGHVQGAVTARRSFVSAGLPQIFHVLFDRLRRSAPGHLVGNRQQGVGIVHSDQSLGAHHLSPFHQPAHAFGQIRPSASLEYASLFLVEIHIPSDLSIILFTVLI